MHTPTPTAAYRATAARSRALLAIFLLAGAGLAYEIALTRLFSLMFQYHYVYLIVSSAVAGLSIGAAVAAWALRKGDVAWGDLAAAAVLLAILLVGAAVVLSQLRSARLTGVALAAALLPFVAIGFLNSAIFARFAEAGGVLYAADLLGGAVGLVAVLGALRWLGALDVVIALGIVAGLVGMILAWTAAGRSARGWAAGATAALVVLLVANQAADVIAFEPGRLKDAPPDKTLMQVLENDDSAAIIETRWAPFARLDVVQTADDSVRYVFTDAGAGSVMIRYSGDDRRIAWLQQDTAYLPFTLAPETTKNVLILGAGAGQDVLMAHLAGAERITAVEINPDLVDLTRDYSDYNGGVFDLPSVETVVTDGRNYVERSDAAYDLIYANLVYSQAAAPASSALAESYIFTREALAAYWDHLSENGRIGFVTHHGIEGLRLVVGALDMLQGEGMTLQQALDHVSLASRQGGDAQARTSVVIITRQPWDAETVQAYTEAAHARATGLLYLPAYQETGLEGLRLGTLTLDDYIATNADEFNFEPTTDDSPFFYQFTPGLPDQLSDLLLFSGILAFAYLSWAMFFYVRRDGPHWKRVALVPYFALLGAGFMLIEVPLIQRFNLLLGQPVLALIVVIGGLLLGGGLGSLASSRFPVRTLPRRAALFAALVAGGALLSLAVYPAIIERALPLALGARAVVTAAALLPLGCVMGMLFPSGLRVAHVADPGGVAAFWGANAVTSVLGSALAMALAIAIGFSAGLATGAALYAAAAILAWVSWPRLLAP